MPEPQSEATGPRIVAGVGEAWPTAVPGQRRSDYLSGLCLRLGRRANHQMLAMVASTPRAAAGFAILRERSDIPVTLPGPAGEPSAVIRARPRRVRRSGFRGAHDHVACEEGTPVCRRHIDTSESPMKFDIRGDGGRSVRTGYRCSVRLGQDIGSGLDPRHPSKLKLDLVCGLGEQEDRSSVGENGARAESGREVPPAARKHTDTTHRAGKIRRCRRGWSSPSLGRWTEPGCLASR